MITSGQYIDYTRHAHCYDYCTVYIFIYDIECNVHECATHGYTDRHRMCNRQVSSSCVKFAIATHLCRWTAQRCHDSTAGQQQPHFHLKSFRRWIYTVNCDCQTRGDVSDDDGDEVWREHVAVFAIWCKWIPNLRKRTRTKTSNWSSWRKLSRTLLLPTSWLPRRRRFVRCKTALRTYDGHHAYSLTILIITSSSSL